MRRLALVLLACSLIYPAAGQTLEWLPAAGLDAGRVSVLRQNDVAPSLLWAGGDGGAYVSSDAGRSWTLKTAGIADPDRRGIQYLGMDVDRRNPDIVYAGIGEQVYRTSDGGNSWSPFGGCCSSTIMLTLDTAKPGILYWAGNVDPSCWAKLSGTSVLFENCEHGIGYVFAIDPTNTDTLYSGTGSFWKSTDGGKTWRLLTRPASLKPPTPPVPPISVMFVRVDDAGVVWIGGYTEYFAANPAPSQARVLRSADGGTTWVDVSRGLPVSLLADPYPMTVRELAASPTNPSVLVAAVGPIFAEPSDPSLVDHADSGFYRTIDGGAHWHRLGGHFEALTVAFAGAKGEVLVGGTLRKGVVTMDAAALCVENCHSRVSVEGPVEAVPVKRHQRQ